MRATIALVIASLSTGCVFGMNAKEFKPAQAPQGVRSTVVTPTGPFTGELIEVREAALVLLADEASAAAPASKRLRMIPFSSVQRADFEQLGSDVRLEGGLEPSPPLRERLRLVSRFPYGMPPGVEGALLKTYGQAAFGGVDR
jgi:hypothetical protein